MLKYNVIGIVCGIWLCACASGGGAHTAEIPTATLPSAPDNKGLLIGIGFGWRKLSQPNSNDEVQMELMLPYDWTLMLPRAKSPTQSAIFVFDAFELRQRTQVVFTYPQDATQAGELVANLETTAYPCLLQRGTHAVVLLAEHTQNEHFLNAIYCKDNKFVQYYHHIAPLEKPNEELQQMQGTAIFKQIVGE